MNRTQRLNQIAHAAKALSTDLDRIIDSASHYSIRVQNSALGKLTGVEEKEEFREALGLIELDLDRIEREIGFIRESVRKGTDELVLGDESSE